MNGTGPDTSRSALWKGKHRNADTSEGLGADRIARAGLVQRQAARLVSSPAGFVCSKEGVARMMSGELSKTPAAHSGLPVTIRMSP
jgi:hypothetical protein